MNTEKIYQRTLHDTVSFVGLGLHSGERSRITLRPSEDAAGIFFRRRDVPAGESLIAARWCEVADTNLSTGLSNRYGHTVSTVEHLMAALRICQIDNLTIDVDGPEIPIMDGSAKPFVDTLLRVGTRATGNQRKAIWVHKPVEVKDGNSRAVLSPDSRPRVTVSIDFRERVIGAQTRSVYLDDPGLRNTIAPSRTFGFVDQIEPLRSQGLVLGGSLHNAVLVDDQSIVNPEGLRFPDEFVRHKILDAIGDLALAGYPVIGHYQAYRSGHHLNKSLLAKLMHDRSAWSYVTLSELHQLLGTHPIAAAGSQPAPVRRNSLQYRSTGRT